MTNRIPIIAAYRAIFPGLFTDASAMPPALRKHVRYPELLLAVQAAVYGLYHMTNPDVFYNREDLWSVATGNGAADQGQQVTEPNFVLMTLPGEPTPEFIEILPFTPANRNNLIAWIAGRSDGEHYGQAVVYDFPKTKLIDGPLQIEARIDQNAQLSGQLTLWNQQGSHVLRGSLIVIPIGRALTVCGAHLPASRSQSDAGVTIGRARGTGPPGLRADVRSGKAALFGGAASTLSAPASPVATGPRPITGPTETRALTKDLNALIGDAARDLSDYQQLTAAGKLGEAGQKLEALKATLEQLQKLPQ